MNISIDRKYMKHLPFSKIKIEACKETSSALISASISISDRVRYEAPCSVDEDGDVVIMSPNIFQMFRSDTITIENTTRTIIISDIDGAVFKEPCVSGQTVDFPEYSDKNAINVEKQLFVSALKSVCHTTHGLLVAYNTDNSTMNVVSTDNAQMSISTIPTSGQGETFECVISDSSAKRLESFLEEEQDKSVQIVNTDASIICKGSNWEYAIQKMNSVFPNYQTAVERVQNSGQITATTEELSYAIQCALLKNSVVILEKTETETVILSESSEMGSFGPYRLNCEQLPLKKIAFDGKKLLKAIKAYADMSGSDTTTLNFGSNDMSPIYIDGSNYLYILMPIMVGYKASSHQMEEKAKPALPIGQTTG